MSTNSRKGTEIERTKKRRKRRDNKFPRETLNTKVETLMEAQFYWIT